MPLTADKPLVKGTTRVSYNDRKLVRMLYSADKNSRQVKQRRKRELTKEDRENLAQTPHMRAEKAFREWLKKACANEQLLDVRDTDDRLAMRAMSSTHWDDLVARRDRMMALDAVLDQAQQNPGVRKGSRADTLLRAASATLQDDANDDLPLLTGRKHIRCFTFRRKKQRRSTILASVPALRRPQRDASLFVEQSRCNNSVDDSESFESDAAQIVVCEPLPTADYDDSGASRVCYRCHVCQKPVLANKAHVQESGAHDALFFHSKCVA